MAVFCLLLLALGTIYLPVVSVTPAVNGQADWAVFDFVTQMRAGALPLKRGISPLATLWLTYAALTVAPLLIWLPGYHKTIGLIALGGLVYSVWEIRPIPFSMVLRAFPHGPLASGDLHVAVLPAAYMLPAILALILYLLWSELSAI